MATVHLIQQGKGGVGKSMIASILYQVLADLELEVYGFDTDPVNNTFAAYQEFCVQRLNILKNDNIDPRVFDQLVERIFELPQDAHVIVDNGASSFIALSSYLKENDALSVFQENGHKVYFHTVITGGQAITDTVQGLKALATYFITTPIVVWLNPYFGEISLDGKHFEDFKVFQEHSAQFSDVIKIPEVNASLAGKDLEELYAKRMSFLAGINSSKPAMVRSRLKKYWQDICDMVSHATFAVKAA